MFYLVQRIKMAVRESEGQVITGERNEEKKDTTVIKEEEGRGEEEGVEEGEERSESVIPTS